MMTCLDDEMVLGLVDGRLAATVLAAVDDHLDACPTCRDVISQLSRARSPSHVLERGQTVGRYVIGELLGSGAMGRVYSAWQPELDRRVAIKVLHEDAPGARDRLVREAQAMARLDHPNIVGVHEVGTTDEGVYVAMDLVEGETLRTWAETPRQWRDVARVMIEVARGLTAVHAAGVIHRDVKPDNIIVGADGRARVGDFGLARAGGTKPSTSPGEQVPSGYGDTPLAVGTPGTSIAGTPAYMAPELLRGGAASAASDQFGFGVTAYEMLAGKRPFVGQTWAELSRAVERGSPAPLRSVPAWLDAAIRRCLAVDPGRRFSSLAALAELLAERSQRRRPMWIAGAAAAAVLASGATWLASRGGSPAATAGCELGATEIASVWNPQLRGELVGLGAPTIAAIDRWTSLWATEHDTTCVVVEPAAKLAARQRCLEHHRTELAAVLDRASLDRSRSRPRSVPGSSTVSPRFDATDASSSGGAAIADRMIDALAGMSPAECRVATPGTADPLPLDPDRATAVREVERDLPAVRAAIALGDARPVIEISAALVERARTSGHAPVLAEALLVRADALRATAQLAEAAIAARDAVASAERGHDDQTAARAWIARVTIAGDRRDLAAAEDLAAIAGGAIDRAGAPPRLIAQLLRLRALVAYNRGQLDEVRTLLVDARSRFAGLAGERSVDVAAVESSLGSTARAAGDLDAAERHHRTALAIDRELRGERHPDIARDLHNIAGVLRLRGKLDGAFATYNAALAIEVATRGERSVEAGLTHNSLGLVKMARRDWAGARVELELALEALAGAGHGDRAFAEHNLGLVAAATGNHLDALDHYRRAGVIYAATIGEHAIAPIRLHLDRARSLAARSGLEPARAGARRALDAAKRADIPWIVDDAQAFLDGNPSIAQVSRRPAVEISVDPSTAPDRPITQPERASEPPPPDGARPRPRRDVGTYGSSQGW